MPNFRFLLIFSRSQSKSTVLYTLYTKKIFDEQNNAPLTKTNKTAESIADQINLRIKVMFQILFDQLEYFASLFELQSDHFFLAGLQGLTLSLTVT